MAARRFKSRLKVPPAVSALGDRWGRTTIPYPRLTGLLAGIVGLLLLMLVSQLIIGGTDLGPSGPQPWGYLDE